MTKQPNPNSIRQKRRKNASLGLSRPQRRANSRLGSALKGYEDCKRADSRNGGKGFTKPGSIKHS